MRSSSQCSILGSLGLLAAVLLEGIAGVRAFQPPQVFENLHALRTIDLTGSYVKEAVVIDVKNTGSESEDRYFYAIRSEVQEKIAIIKGKENGDTDLLLNKYTEQDSEK